jgi:RHS repeat-associated protein
MTVTSSSERYRFAGHERDQRTGYDSMHARYYAPMAGRFFSVDPGRDYDFSHPQSFNLYAYVRNNPVNAVDPTGRYSWARSTSSLSSTETYGGWESVLGFGDTLFFRTMPQEAPGGASANAKVAESKEKEEETKKALEKVLTPEIIQGLRTLFEKAGFGRWDHEYGGWIFEYQGSYFLREAGTSAEYHQNTMSLVRSPQWTVVANVHTHPNRSGPGPSDTDKVSVGALKDKLGGQPRFVITLHRQGVYVHDFLTGITVRALGPNWFQNQK